MYEQGKNNFWWFLRVSKPSYFNFEPYMSKSTERSKELYHHQVGTTFYVLDEFQLYWGEIRGNFAPKDSD